MTSLPIESALPELIHTLSQHHEVILEAPPGAGKTTRVPLALLDQPWLEGKKILLLEPRRLAARTAAQHMADLLGEKVGQRVGYRVRLDSRISAATRIEIVTEGVLIRLLQDDPSLEDYALVIFDEFHERSLDADLGLALTLEARAIFREEAPLRLLLMSATLDGAMLSALLNQAPVVRSEGRSYPVRTIYAGEPDRQQWLEDKVMQVVQQALTEHSGSILCFLPGIGEIRRVESRIREQIDAGSWPSVMLTPLYGDLNLNQQQAAIQPAPEGQRKLVLATSIAETSLTIQGISVVIDSGLSREARFDPNSAMSRLHTRRVALAEATQRQGRAGRLGAGVCYRLWNESQQQQLRPFAPPEILQADLCQLMLQLSCWGVTDPASLIWLDPPPAAHCQQARDLLLQLGAITPQGATTAQGEAMAAFAAHPRISHMLIRARELNLERLACRIAALLLERDPFSDQGADLQHRLDWLDHKPGQHRALHQRLHKQAEQYLRQCQTLPPGTESNIPPPEQPGLLLALAYPDRIASQRSEGAATYRLNQGRAAEMQAYDSLTRHQWISIAQLRGKQGQRNDFISLAAALNPALLETHIPELCSEREQVRWDRQSDRLIARQQRCIGDLVYLEKPLPSPSEESVVKAIIAMIRQRGLNLLPWSDELRQWQQRVVFIRNQATDNPEWPDLSDTWLEQNLEHWLGPYLGQVRELNDLNRLNLGQILQALLPWPLPQQLDKLAPERFQVPSGSRIRIDYSSNPPVLAVKLQEMFGCITTPTIGHGIALQLHLLSPARRPLQVTQDLTTFWQNGYPEIKKEMKGRYPKHPWPDDPLQALPTAKTKRHPPR
ncbi:ATP-dependent helicase HrpB [Neptuniibacter halophilus]|uniref:ATP-dependent helicase HrpB n=1 Tax=Neptuniibacter halophilus TaxID=651666 RepID=UPI002572EAA0|nr:ATP-dependent helicase HrpB [Neptuniibacter halophilus]